MTATLTIFHRIDRPFEELAPGIELRQIKYAYAYSAAVPIAFEDANPREIAEGAFAACGNCPYPVTGWHAVQAAHERAQRRSLSVGDIVVIDRHSIRVGFIVLRNGWKRVPVGLTTGQFLVDYPITH